MQVGAIISGIQPGLTMVVGPPGTGKTDTAVQILNVLYHNCPSQRTLIITHSNQALNDLFEKIMEVLDSSIRCSCSLAILSSNFIIVSSCICHAVLISNCVDDFRGMCRLDTYFDLVKASKSWLLTLISAVKAV